MPAGAGGPGAGGPGADGAAGPVPMDAAAMGRLLEEVNNMRLTMQDQQARLNQQAEDLINTRESLQATTAELQVAQAAIQANVQSENMDVDQASSVAEKGGKCRNNARVRPYGGEPVVEPWSFWRQHFHAVAQFNRWSVHEAKLMLVAAMRGEAQATAQAAEVQSVKTVEELLDAYEKVFLPPTLMATLRKAFMKIRQKKGESIRYLATRISHSYRTIYKEEERRERDLVDRFIEALEDRKVARDTDLKDPETLQDAVNYALQAASWGERTTLEQEGILPLGILPIVDPRGAAQQGAAQTVATPAIVAMTPTTSNQNQGASKGRNKGRGGGGAGRVYSFCGHCGSRQHPAKECPNCWTCGSKDHFRGECPKKRGNNGSGNKTGGPSRGRAPATVQTLQDGNPGGEAGQQPPDFS